MLSSLEEQQKAVAKKKLQKFQFKKGGLEQETIRLKEALFKSENQIEWMEHEIQNLKQRNKEYKKLILKDDGEIQFMDHKVLEAYEREERTIFNDFRKKMKDLKERYRGESAEVCSGCTGELIEV